MPGCSTPPIGSPQGWLETERANRSTSRKPIPPSPSVGRAAIVSTDRHSSTRITTPAGSLPFSATRQISSGDQPDAAEPTPALRDRIEQPFRTALEAENPEQQQPRVPKPVIVDAPQREPSPDHSAIGHEGTQAKIREEPHTSVSIQQY